MLSLRYYLEYMKSSSDVISKTYLIHDNGQFYSGETNQISLTRINIYNIHKYIGKTVYVEYQSILNMDYPVDCKTYYQTEIKELVHHLDNYYIKFNNVSVLNLNSNNQTELYGANLNSCEYCYMRIGTLPTVKIFAENV